MKFNLCDNVLELCVFVLGFSSHLRTFAHFGDVIITGEALQI